MPDTVLAPQPLSTADFHARIHALEPRIAVFDCDGTLWSGDAGSSFMRWSMETGLLSAERTHWLLERYEGYRTGQVSELAICGDMTAVYAGLTIEALRAAAARFFAEHIEPHIFPEMLELVRSLQRSGCEIWAVSSTNDWVVEEGVQRFRIPAERVLAARVATEGAGALQRATNAILDVPTDEGKVASLRNAGITAPDCVFGNSVHDAAMLAIARGERGSEGAFPVNPTAGLLERSAREGWPVYYPASVAP